MSVLSILCELSTDLFAKRTFVKGCHRPQLRSFVV